MTIVLTPDQQTKLDQFEKDAQAANDAASDNVQAQATLLVAQQDALNDAQKAITTMQDALASGQVFIDAMLGISRPSGLKK